MCLHYLADLSTAEVADALGISSAPSSRRSTTPGRACASRWRSPMSDPLTDLLAELAPSVDAAAAREAFDATRRQRRRRRRPSAARSPSWWWPPPGPRWCCSTGDGPGTSPRPSEPSTVAPPAPTTTGGDVHDRHDDHTPATTVPPTTIAAPLLAVDGCPRSPPVTCARPRQAVRRTTPDGLPVQAIATSAGDRGSVRRGPALPVRIRTPSDVGNPVDVNGHDGRVFVGAPGKARSAGSSTTAARRTSAPAGCRPASSSPSPAPSRPGRRRRGARLRPHRRVPGGMPSSPRPRRRCRSAAPSRRATVPPPPTCGSASSRGIRPPSTRSGSTRHHSRCSTSTERWSPGHDRSTPTSLPTSSTTPRHRRRSTSCRRAPRRRRSHRCRR